MRDPARIDRILNLVREVWELMPDLRLGQLIVNATPGALRDVFYVEDDVLERGIRLLRPEELEQK